MKNDHKFYIKSLEERQKFVQFLANGLPWRTLYSVYHRFKYLYRNHEKRFQRYIRSYNVISITFITLYILITSFLYFFLVLNDLFMYFQDSHQAKMSKFYFIYRIKEKLQKMTKDL